MAVSKSARALRDYYAEQRANRSWRRAIVLLARKAGVAIPAVDLRGIGALDGAQGELGLLVDPLLARIKALAEQDAASSARIRELEEQSVATSASHNRAHNEARARIGRLEAELLGVYREAAGLRAALAEWQVRAVGAKSDAPRDGVALTPRVDPAR